MENLLYPLKFNPILKDKIWGGAKLGKLFGKDEFVKFVLGNIYFRNNKICSFVKSMFFYN